MYLFSAAVDKKLKIDFVSLKASKLLPLVVKQGRFLTASLRQFYSRFFSKAERGCAKTASILAFLFLSFREYDGAKVMDVGGEVGNVAGDLLTVFSGVGNHGKIPLGIVAKQLVE